MVFQLLVEGSRRAKDRAKAPGASSVFETFLGPHGEEFPPHSASDRETGEPRVDELVVSAVRLFRTDGVGGRIGHTFDRQMPVQRTSALLLVAVPMEVSLLGVRRFFGRSLDDAVETLRVLRWYPREGSNGGVIAAGDAASSAPAISPSFNFYSIVLLCRTQTAADALYREHHGRLLRDQQQLQKPGTSSEDSVGGPCCYLLFLESVAYREVSTPAAEIPAEMPKMALELPMCPFCLERLDVSVSGMITHNAGWLSSIKWDEVPHSQCCAACATIHKAGLGEGELPACPQCDVTEDLWVCLVCGHIGCGRYTKQHAKDHAMACGHQFGLDLYHGRIWYYAGDVFVHRRLVQMVAATGRFEVAALPEAHESGGSSHLAVDAGSKGPCSWREEDHLAMELDAVLASQLDYQRTLYEAKLRGLDEQHRRRCEEVDAEAEVHRAQQKVLESELAEAQQERRRLERRRAQAQQSKAKAEKELDFAKQINASLLANKSDMRKNSHASSASGRTGAAAAGSGDQDPVAAVSSREDALVQRLRQRVTKLMEAVESG